MARPRWLGLAVVVGVLVAAFVQLGRWQLDVARDDAQREAVQAAAERPVVDLATVFAPHADFPRDGSGQRLRATGRYDGAHQVLVADRRLDGVEGWWVLVPLLVDGSGARIPVVRGFVASVASAPPAPSTALTLVGSLAPSESPRVARAPLGPGEVAAVDVPALLNVWGGEVYNGFLFALSEMPDPADVSADGSAAGGPGMRRVPPPQPSAGLAARNAAYAVQWWAFAAFVVWMWWKMVRDDHRRSGSPAAAGVPGHDTSDAGAPP